MSKRQPCHVPGKLRPAREAVFTGEGKLCLGERASAARLIRCVQVLRDSIDRVGILVAGTGFPGGGDGMRLHRLELCAFGPYAGREAVERGAQGFVGKPFDLRALIEQTKQIVPA